MSDRFLLHGRTAIVTGGASGIGRAIAETFAGRGASVHIVDVDLENARSAARPIEAAAHGCDVSDQAAVDRLFDAIAADGGIHILVNSVGISHIGTLETTTAEDFDRIYRVNVKSYFNAMRAAVRHMKPAGGGVILNLASLAASIGIPDRFAYSASKGAVLSMTYSVAKDYIQQGIRCNCISPARVHTPFVDGYLKRNYPGREEEMFRVLSEVQPIGRMGTPQEIAWLALFLCSDEAAYITGADYPIDGGFLNLR
ncbi:MAG TPA: SDR family oxidoreductase [Bryobacteraceae bacterium]